MTGRPGAQWRPTASVPATVMRSVVPSIRTRVAAIGGASGPTTRASALTTPLLPPRARGTEEQVRRAHHGVAPPVSDRHRAPDAEPALDRRGLDRRRQREHETRVAPRPADGRHRLPHRGQYALRLLAATARQEPDHERPIVEAEGAPRGDPVGGTAERVEERVADELDGH